MMNEGIGRGHVVLSFKEIEVWSSAKGFPGPLYALPVQRVAGPKTRGLALLLAFIPHPNTLVYM